MVVCGGEIMEGAIGYQPDEPSFRDLRLVHPKNPEVTRVVLEQHRVWWRPVEAHPDIGEDWYDDL